MKDLNSRYATGSTLTYVKKNSGTLEKTEIAYHARRFIPAVNNLTVEKQIVVTQGQRLDLISHDTIGHPERFWAIADINTTLNPFSLTSADRIGKTLKIPTLLSLLYKD